MNNEWLFTSEIVCEGSIERNNRIVISPLGATNINDWTESFENLSWINRNAKMKNTIHKEHVKLSAMVYIRLLS